LAVDYSFTPAKPDKQLKRAQELGALNAVKLGRGAGEESVVRVRDLKTRQERVLSRLETLAEFRQR